VFLGCLIVLRVFLDVGTVLVEKAPTPPAVPLEYSPSAPGRHTLVIATRDVLSRENVKIKHKVCTRKSCTDFMFLAYVK
jgi:hypothetical protein